jgi:hypothetical protein
VLLGVRMGSATTKMKNSRGGTDEEERDGTRHL